MTELPPYTRTPLTTADGTEVVGWWPAVRRCSCGRPVLATSLDGTNCSEHDGEVAG